MYRCAQCHTVPASGTPSKLLVVETRRKDHPRRPEVNAVPLADKPGSYKWVDNRGGSGLETVRERRVCPACALT
jgi:hypothetical protein